MKLGRKFKLEDADIERMEQMRKAGIPVSDILDYFKIGKTTYYRYINKSKVINAKIKINKIANIKLNRIANEIV
ncbi:helix-turn-helix domain-containing protein [Paramaledivibacter caminithermalis]|uniref:helix-turn-helix domain-containing protein n=1 Tax=Paramaledivibacter caminithermalis TaxID=191027 RepID=UPI0024186364|nr:helix-turn-helix domain-containing protein [Paramaledivibacter caminithermalis]